MRSPPDPGRPSEGSQVAIRAFRQKCSVSAVLMGGIVPFAGLGVFHYRRHLGTMRAPTGLGRGESLDGGDDRRQPGDSAQARKPPEGLFVFVLGLTALCFLWPEFVTTMSATLRERLIALIEPLVGRLGYELVDLEHTAGRGSAVVRLFIDRSEGVGLTDCERVSREVSALLDVEDPIPTAYTLEVSSPGFDRVLRTQAHFARFVGSRVAVELAAPREGRRADPGR